MVIMEVRISFGKLNELVEGVNITDTNVLIHASVPEVDNPLRNAALYDACNTAQWLCLRSLCVYA